MLSPGAGRLPDGQLAAFAGGGFPRLLRAAAAAERADSARSPSAVFAPAGPRGSSSSAANSSSAASAAGLAAAASDGEGCLARIAAAINAEIREYSRLLGDSLSQL